MAGMLRMFAFFVRTPVGSLWRSTVPHAHGLSSTTEKRVSVRVGPLSCWADAPYPVEFGSSSIRMEYATIAPSTKFLSTGDASAEVASQGGLMIDAKLTVTLVKSPLMGSVLFAPSTPDMTPSSKSASVPRAITRTSSASARWWFYRPFNVTLVSTSKITKAAIHVCLHAKHAWMLRPAPAAPKRDTLPLGASACPIVEMDSSLGESNATITTIGVAMDVRQDASKKMGSSAAVCHLHV